jgi:hypothetical protein
MADLSSNTRDALLHVGTSTLTGILNRRSLKNMFLQEVWPIRQGQPRLVGLAYTMRFIPAREDKAPARRRRRSSSRLWRAARRGMCSSSMRAATRAPPRPETSIAGV